MKAGIAIIAVGLLLAGAPALAQQSKTAAKPSAGEVRTRHSVAAKNPAPNQTASHATASHPTQPMAPTHRRHWRTFQTLSVSPWPI